MLVVYLQSAAAWSALYIAVTILLSQPYRSWGMRVPRSWSPQPSCEAARVPPWPLAYTKYIGQDSEDKGRVNSNEQDFRHECEYRGVQSKCHICEDIACGTNLDQTCSLQLQGVDFTLMSSNIPTAADTPWAVGGSHRNDFNNSVVTRVCQLLSGGHCLDLSVSKLDYFNCSVRCWAHNASLAENYVIGTHDDTLWDYTPTDVWNYEKTQTVTSTYTVGNVPSYNPQGYMFTLAGGGQAGFADGTGASARFNHPQDVAVDANLNVYVADTNNHRIRKVSSSGVVTTVAGSGKEGHEDGDALTASFSYPSGIAIYYGEEGDPNLGGSGQLQLLVADRNNHRIRLITGSAMDGTGAVSCFAGRCGNKTDSWTLMKQAATPEPGYADGEAEVARFDSPNGLAVDDTDGTVYVADTNNHLVRMILPNGTVFTLAGNVERTSWQDGDAEESYTSDKGAYAGCPPPCLTGVPGHRDGNLSYALFDHPLDVAVMSNRTIMVVEKFGVRMITSPGVISEFIGVESEGRVVTLAGYDPGGSSLDGLGKEAGFDGAAGVTVTADDVAYVVDGTSCRVKRVAPVEVMVQDVSSCTAPLTEVLRPSGCGSYDPPVGKTDKTVSSVFGNIYYNHAYRQARGHAEDGVDFIGREIKDCVGSPPPDQRDISAVPGDSMVITGGADSIKEDTGDGTTIILRCPSSCVTATSSSSFEVKGSGPYTDDSAVCMAAVHAGVLSGDVASSASNNIDNPLNLIIVTLERGPGVFNASQSASSYFNYSAFFAQSSTHHNVTSEGLVHGIVYSRMFSIEAFRQNERVVQTLVGHPAALLTDACGPADAFNQPPQEAYMDGPRGVDAYRHTNLTHDGVYLYVADTNNHVIRLMSAVCAFLCENGGRCTALDTCVCPSGWTGADCSIPDCSGTTCGNRKVCVGPNTCGCVPGYSGTACDVPLCVQDCNNGICGAPDTCACDYGWFGTNCTVPTCAQTCGNGGNCTAPGYCSCPSQWQDTDCREPVCTQMCANGGFCTAPDTCTCPPQWTGYDCSLPVCTQGFFRSTFNITDHDPDDYPLYWQEYVPCDYADWCNDTNGFDCSQPDRTREPLSPLWGPAYRDQSGRSAQPDRCSMIEVGVNVITPFSYALRSNESTANARYSPLSPYEWRGNPPLPWYAYDAPTAGKTAPWLWKYDRQVAMVEFHNVSQGLYICAHGGNCTSPGVCECAPGWAGFDCRTPICTQGYWVNNQDSFVSGQESSGELARFEVFMDPNSVKLDWLYSNPSYNMVWENFVNKTNILRYNRTHGDVRYLGPSDWSASASRTFTYQGGYRCSIRAWTRYENRDEVTENSNYFSRYMDDPDGSLKLYWQDMEWPPLHYKTPVLVYNDSRGNHYTYTDRGYMKDGEWLKTGQPWVEGVCLLEFNRTCKPDDPVDKRKDLESLLYDILVQDPDISYRARVTYTDFKENTMNSYRWDGWGREDCVDYVIRGCYNNGTCVAPDTCQCAEGWSGYDCSIPICEPGCSNAGNCTLPGICTCARGWEGDDCSVPVCAQQCNNDARCVAPDVCQCRQWPSLWVDGRAAGGRPLFRKPNGDSQDTGWTGYDCATPICVQGMFYYNTRTEADYSTSSSDMDSAAVARARDVTDVIGLGGHGFDGTKECKRVRCPLYDKTYTANDGYSFQTGCGWDPMDTGCCTVSGTTYTCMKCKGTSSVSPHNYTCSGGIGVVTYTNYFDIDKQYFDDDEEVMYCGHDHSPVPYYVDTSPLRDNYNYSSHNYRSNETGHRFLCGRGLWEMGNFPEGGLELYAGASGINSDFGLDDGRQFRINYPNYTASEDGETWAQGEITRGEGVYACHNGGSCLAPDTCSCADGWDGFDCATPLCRHRQASGVVSSCENGGVCVDKDKCKCIQTESALWQVYEKAVRGATGWTGTDCSLPMCVQGYFDPFCTDLPQAPGGEGCYRCANNGNCTAPDTCMCDEGWTGYDCRTPVCEVVADSLTRENLDTVDEERVIAFESDPCKMEERYDPVEMNGALHYRGNCTLPSRCSCTCFAAYSKIQCISDAVHCDGAWQDPLVQYRDVLSLGHLFGTRSCYIGYEGLLGDDNDYFTTCHLAVYNPSWVERRSIELIIGGTLSFFFGSILYYCVRRRIKRKKREAKAAKRRSKRSSELSQLDGKQNVFLHKPAGP